MASAVEPVDTEVDGLLESGKLSREEVLELRLLDVCELLNVGYADAQRLVEHLALGIAPASSTALEMLQEREGTPCLWTGLPDLDMVLRRGVPAGVITEIVGPASVGKSQMCHMLTYLGAAQSPFGMGARVLYIDTEGKFSEKRLAELARARFERQRPAGAGDAEWEVEVGAAVHALLGRVLTVRPQSVDELVRDLHGVEATARAQDVRLVVLDSIAALMRLDYGGGDRGVLIERQGLVGRAASLLKSAAEALRIPVVVTNQVTARMGAAAAHNFQQGAAAGEGSMAGGSVSSGGLSAALGTVWAHAVNVRVVLERHGSRRLLKLAKSPAAPNIVLEYAIGALGVEQVMGAQLADVGDVLGLGIVNEVLHEVGDTGEGYEGAYEPGYDAGYEAGYEAGY